MQSEAPAGPSRDTGLPPGVEVGPLGSRVVAYLIDSLVPAILVTVLSFLAPGLSGGGRVVLSTVLVLLTLAWAVLVLIMIAARAASPGMKAMKLQLVGFYDGRPIGLPRALLRGLVFWAGPKGPGIQRSLPLEAAAAQIARACGPVGSNAEYLYKTVASLEEHGIHDRNLWKLQKLVAQEIDGLRP